jgi:hypothetical protein
MSQLSVTGGRDVHTVHFPVAIPPAEVEVLIVGAGPVGLSAAVELASRGLNVAVGPAPSGTNIVFNAKAPRQRPARCRSLSYTSPIRPCAVFTVPRTSLSAQTSTWPGAEANCPTAARRRPTAATRRTTERHQHDPSP